MKSPELEPTAKNILIEVDIQNDFVDGSLAVPGGEGIIEPINDLAEIIRDNDGQVIATRDWHPAETPHFDNWPIHCVADTAGAEFHPNLNVADEDIILSKGMGQTDGYSGWEGISDTGESLETLLSPDRDEKVRVFIGGLATDYCVRATTIDIAKYFSDEERVQTYLLRDAISAVGLSENDEQNAINDMETAGANSISTAEAITIIEGEK